MSKLTPEQREYYFNYYYSHGMTAEQAESACDLWDICSLDSPRRLYNEIKENKDRETQEHMRKKFSPNKAIKDCYAIAREMRESKDPNLTLNF
jgi:hypothetical protein